MLFKGKSIKSVANKVLNKLLHSRDETAVEVKADTWKSMYPFFCNQAFSTSSVAIESLKILDVLIDNGIVGDYKNLQKALLHKNDEVAHLALDVLRKIKGLTIETKTERAEQVIESNGEHIEKVPKKTDQLIKETGQLMQKDKDFESKIFSVLKREDSIAEKLPDIEEKVEELSQKISEVPSNLAQDYDNKFKALEDNMEELKKIVNSNIASKDALVESVVSKKLPDIKEKVKELSQKTSEVPSNLVQDYDNKFKVLEDNIEELKKIVNSNISSKDALVESVVAEKLTNIEEKVEDLCQKTLEVPSNQAQDYNNKFKVLEDNIEELKKIVNSNIASKDALLEKVVSEKLTNIEEKVEDLCQKTSEVPSNLAQDYNNKFKALEDNIEELKKLVSSNITSKDALVEKVAVQVLERIKPTGHISKSRISSISQFKQKTAEDSQHMEEVLKLSFLDNTPESSIILLNWVKFLMEKVGRNNLANILEYYVEIGWISEEVCSTMANYASGLDYYVETPAEDLLPEVHTKSLLFIEQLRRWKMDKKPSSVPTSRYGSTIPTHSL